MTKESLEYILNMNAGNYMTEFITVSYLRARALNWLRFAHDDIIENSRHCTREECAKEIVLVSDLIRYSSKTLLRCRNIGKMTVDAMNAALKTNGLSFDMNSCQKAALLRTCDAGSEIEIVEKFAIGLGELCKITEDGVQINFGRNVVPGYELTLNLKRIL